MIVGSLAQNDGKIVHCLRFAGVVTFKVGGDRPAWEVDQYLPTLQGVTANLVADDILRPIRDPGDDAVDESLLWLPVPVKETA